MRGLVVACAVLALSSCGGGEPCCNPTLAVMPGTRYVATIPSPDGGTPTRIEFVMTTRPTEIAAGSATLTFRNAGREVAEVVSAELQQR